MGQANALEGFDSEDSEDVVEEADDSDDGKDDVDDSAVEGAMEGGEVVGSDALGDVGGVAEDGWGFRCADGVGAVGDEFRGPDADGEDAVFCAGSGDRECE
jgi:hypothetical protein